MRATPRDLPDGILLGWTMPEDGSEGARLGFSATAEARPSPSAPIMLLGEGHRITIAPSGAGKSSGPVAADLLTHDGPAIVFDPTGSLYATTAAWRRSIGQKVHCLDPFRITDHAERFGEDSLDPLDLIDPRSENAVLDAGALADALINKGDMRDPHWEIRAAQFTGGLILHAATHAPRGHRNLAVVADALSASTEGFAGVLAGMELSEAHDGRLRRCSTAIQAVPDKERGSILSTCLRDLDFLAAPSIRRATRNSTISVKDIVDGAPMTIYVALPPHMLATLSPLLRAWVTVALTAISRRTTIPEKRTLFLLDEAAQLGGLASIKTTVTLMRNYGVSCHLLYQSRSQLLSAFPNDWETILDNCAGLVAFGFRTRRLAEGASDLTGYGGKRPLFGLPDDVAVLVRPGVEPRCVLRPDALSDPALLARAACNPRYAKLDAGRRRGEENR